MSAVGTDARYLIVTGLVQGVGFRHSMAETAHRLKVTGWVRNRNDGSVEAVIAGATDALAEMINWVSRGPTAARVDEVLVEQIDQSQPFKNFILRPTE